MVTLLLFGRGLRKEQNRVAFLSIIKNPMAASAGIVLIFFLMIAVLDSIHLSNAKSLLDQVLSPLGAQYEKTYSAPFALKLYSSEMVGVNGHFEQVYPRLSYPPPSVQTREDIQHVVKVGLIKSFGISVLFLLFIALGGLFYRRKKRASERFLDPSHLLVNKRLSSSVAPYITLFFVGFILLSAYQLSRDFHIFGTGKIGEDIFYYAVKSIRTGLVIGTLTTLFMMPLALLLGISAGYFGGIVDDIIQYIYTTLSSIPGVLLITASVLSMQTYIANHPEQFKTLADNADARLLALCFILGVTSWTSLCRLLRAEALKLREIDYVLAAKALGSSSFKIIRTHLLPNVMHIVIITLVLDFSFLVLAEAVLSYVGVGVSPMTLSWGNMINAARLELAREPIVWWPMLAAFLLMFSLVLAINLFADAVRDAFDPHHSR